jgi:hypothetical protein
MPLRTAMAMIRTVAGMTTAAWRTEVVRAVVAMRAVPSMT